MHYRLFLAAGMLLASCSAPDLPAEKRAAAPPPLVPPAASVPDTVAGYAFLRQNMRLSFEDSPDVRGEDGWFFSRVPFPLTAGIANRLAPPDTASRVLVIGRFQEIPAPVLNEFRQQILHLDLARQRRLRWDPARLGQLVFIDSAGATIRPELAGQVRGVSPAQRRTIRRAIGEWNHSPVADRFFSYASWPLFTADGHYALIVRGQAQQSIGWDSIFIYERTATGWKIRESAQISTI